MQRTWSNPQMSDGSGKKPDAEAVYRIKQQPNDLYVQKVTKPTQEVVRKVSIPVRGAVKHDTESDRLDGEEDEDDEEVEEEEEDGQEEDVVIDNVGKFSIRVQKGETVFSRYLGKPDSSREESSDERPHAVFVRPSRMKIFQTEVEDDEEEEEEDEDDEEEEEEEEEEDEDENRNPTNNGEEESEDAPPVPPPRSKSKESSLANDKSNSKTSGPVSMPGISSKATKSDNNMKSPSRSPNDRSVYFDAVGEPEPQHYGGQRILDGSGGNKNSSAVIRMHVGGNNDHPGGPGRRSTSGNQERSLGSFCESKNKETVEKGKISEPHLRSSSESCSRSGSDHSNKHHRHHHHHHRHHHRPKPGKQSCSKSSSSSGAAPVMVGTYEDDGEDKRDEKSARRISLDDLSSAFQAILTTNKRPNAKSSRSKDASSGSNAKECCQSDNSVIDDKSKSSSNMPTGAAADKLRSRSEESLLDTGVGNTSRSEKLALSLASDRKSMPKFSESSTSPAAVASSPGNSLSQKHTTGSSNRSSGSMHTSPRPPTTARVIGSR